MNKEALIDKWRIRGVSAEVVLVIMFLTTWMTYDGDGIIHTIPFIIIIPFILRLFYKNSLLIVGTAVVSGLIIAHIKGNFGYGIFLIVGILMETFAAVVLAMGIKHKDSAKRILFIALGVLMIIMAVNDYAKMWGSPMGYLKAKSNIEGYIDDNYEGQLKIERIDRISFKMRGYRANVVQIEDSRNKSTIFYGDNGYISDRYHDETTGNMTEQVTNILIAMIENQTDLTDYDISLYAKLEIPVAKYHLNDRFSGDEPISADIQLQPNYSWKQKDNEQREVKVYGNKEAFAEDAYKVIAVLQNIGYRYDAIKVYYFLEDGNTTYEIIVQGGEEIKAVQDAVDKVQMGDYSKEK
ncbi:hypothetical protein [Cellulosilyticum sp. I15G10I2]|uniref:hypothetical protein n=1 Tax=Cellulosilyticum sp. I15G10I2 TaxID=1892843 RepID=UPI00085CB155|nr:hypothetical protein [Cellulosilyticum sp. I15G10I2]